MPELGLVRGLITLLTLMAFLGICWWAYRSDNRVRFEEDGWLAFGDEEPLPLTANTDRKSDEATDRMAEGIEA